MKDMIKLIACLVVTASIGFFALAAEKEGEDRIICDFRTEPEDGKVYGNYYIEKTILTLKSKDSVGHNNLTEEEESKYWKEEEESDPEWQVDESGNIYLFYWQRRKIRKYNFEGKYDKTICIKNERLKNLNSFAVDEDGDIYITYFNPDISLKMRTAVIDQDGKIKKDIAEVSSLSGYKNGWLYAGRKERWQVKPEKYKLPKRQDLKLSKMSGRKMKLKGLTGWGSVELDVSKLKYRKKIAKYWNVSINSVDKSGNIYLLYKIDNPTDVANPEMGDRSYGIAKYDKKGKLIVNFMLHRGGRFIVDVYGNIYQLWGNGRGVVRVTKWSKAGTNY